MLKIFNHRKATLKELWLR